MKLINSIKHSIDFSEIGFLFKKVFYVKLSTPENILENIRTNLIYAYNLSKMAKDNSKNHFLREISQQLYNDLENELMDIKELDEIHKSEKPIKQKSLLYTHKDNQHLPFDLAYAYHQLRVCDETIELLRYSTKLGNNIINYVAIKNSIIFIKLKEDLKEFLENHLKSNNILIHKFSNSIQNNKGNTNEVGYRQWMAAEEIAIGD